MNKFLIGLALVTFLTSGSATMAADNITLADHTAWARATPPGTSTTAIYLTLVNHGNSGSKLITATANISERLELHTHRAENGMMKMQQIPSIDLPAGETTALKPHGNHIMVFNLVEPLEVGDTVELHLLFDDQQTLTVEVPVAKNGLPSSEHQRSAGEHKMKKEEHSNEHKSH